MKLDLKLRGIKKYYLNQKGITLIALVVTIVVLLILAGVSINALFGNNGIISRAKDTKKVTNLSSLKDEIGIVIQSRNINKMAGLPAGSFKEELENGISGNKTVEAIGIIGDTCYVTREEATVTVYDNGDIIDGKADIWDGTSKSKPTADESKNWHIYTPEEMKYFEEFVNGKLTEEEKEGLEITDSTIIYLENDIDMGARQENGVLTAGTAWEPIGIDSAGKFTGTFEGNNHTVKGIYVKKDGKFAGIFGNSDTIQNLTIADSYIEVTGNGAGGIVGVLREGSIVNCHNINTRVSSSEDGNNVGGIVGQFSGEKIDNCTNTGDIKSSGYSIGGIAGLFVGKTTDNCVNKGEISGGKENAYAQTGGIVGTSTGTIINSKNNGTIIANGYSSGGIVGFMSSNSDERIEKCINTGKVQAKEVGCGGICGLIGKDKTAIINQCVNTGTVQGDNGFKGGICGTIGGNSSSTIKNCYNLGNIIGEASNVSDVSGIISCINQGFSGTISKNYNLGKIIIKGQNVKGIGGVIGYFSATNTENATIKNNYYKQGIVENADNDYGESKTEAEMKTEEFLALLNADQETPVWELNSSKNNGYPSLIGVD